LFRCSTDGVRWEAIDTIEIRRRHPIGPILCGLGLILGLLVADAARADIVHLRDGRRLEGRVLSEDDEKTVLETRFGTISIARGDIKRIERKLTPREKARAEFEALDAGDRDGLLALADRCEKERFKSLASEILREALDRWPDDEEVRARLGFVRHEGEWVTEAEHYRLKGYVRYDRKWYAPEDLVEFEGKKIPPEKRDKLVGRRRLAAERRDRYLADGRPWSAAETFKSNRFALTSNCTRKRSKEVLDILNRFFSAYRNPFVSGKARDSIKVDLFRTRQAFLAFSSRTKQRNAENVAGYYIPGKDQMVFFDRPGDQRNFANTVRHEAIHAHLDQVAEGYVPRWIHEGFATYFSGDPGADSCGAEGYLYLTRIQEMIRTGTAPTLWDLLQPKLFTPDEYAASWSLIDLFARDRALQSGFKKFLKAWIQENKDEKRARLAVARKSKNSRNPFEALSEMMRQFLKSMRRRTEHGQDLLDCLKMNEEELVGRWRDHVETRYNAGQSPRDSVFRALALADLAWQELNHSGIAAAARARSLVDRAEEALTFLDEASLGQLRPGEVNKILETQLNVARARLATISRIAPGEAADAGEALLAAAHRWAAIEPDDASRQFFAGHALASTVDRLLSDLEGLIGRIHKWGRDEEIEISRRWSGRLEKINLAAADFSSEWGGEEIRRRIVLLQPVIEEIAAESALLLNEAALIEPPFADAVGELVHMTLAVDHESLPMAREALSFLMKVDPSDQAHVWVAQIRLRENDRRSALEHLQMALDLEPEHPDATALKKELEKK